MKYALELFFDDVTTEGVRRAWDAIGEATGVRYLQTVGAFPHVALTVFESDACDIARLLDQVVDSSAPLRLTPDSLGSFPGGVVFVKVSIEPALSQLHARAVDICRRHGVSIWNHYLPGGWTPHCTLMQTLVPEQIDAALQAVPADILRLPWTVRSAGVITFPPTRLIDERRWPA